MKCLICRMGYTKSGRTSVVLERDQATIVFKHIPAEICENCGEEYISAKVNKEMLLRAEKAFSRGIMLELLDFAA